SRRGPARRRGPALRGAYGLGPPGRLLARRPPRRVVWHGRDRPRLGREDRQGAAPPGRARRPRRMRGLHPRRSPAPFLRLGRDRSAVGGGERPRAEVLARQRSPRAARVQRGLLPGREALPLEFGGPPLLTSLGPGKRGPGEGIRRTPRSRWRGGADA